MRQNMKGTSDLARPTAFRVVRSFVHFFVRVVRRVFCMLLCIMLVGFLARAYVPDLFRNALGFRQAQQVSVTVLREELQALSELATYEFTYVNHADFTNQPQLFGQNVLLTDHWFAFDYHGTIKAGFDLEELDVLWVDSVDQTVGIRLPSVAVISNEIYADMSTYEDRNNICNPLQPREVLDFLYAQKEPELEKALGRNLLGLAKDNARHLISVFVEGLGYSAVFVD